MAHVGVRILRQLAREARHEAELRVRIGERPEVIAIQQFGRGARAEQQHHLDPALGDGLRQQRQHGTVGRDPGAGADQQVPPVGIAGHQAEATERATGVDVVARIKALKQRRGRAAGHVADRDLDRLARCQRVVADGGQRVAALGGGTVGIAEMHLDELPGDEIQRQSVVAHEHVVAHGRGEHAAMQELEREMDDGQGVGATLWCRAWPGGAPIIRVCHSTTPPGRH